MVVENHRTMEPLTQMHVQDTGTHTHTHAQTILIVFHKIDNNNMVPLLTWL